jgi:DNA modification methylase
MTWEIRQGSALDLLRAMPTASVHCVVTSPPYWGLRDYGVDGQLGLEATPEEYVANLVEIFREVRRVLRSDGTLWLNLGDSYVANPGSGYARGNLGGLDGADSPRYRETMRAAHGASDLAKRNTRRNTGLKPKDLVGIPWRAAFALQADGWYLRADNIWQKPNPMPESVSDRTTRAHEYVFHFAKSERYFYDADAVAETALRPEGSGNTNRKFGDDADRPGSHLGRSIPWEGSTRNRRSVWTIAVRPFAEAHFATFPPELPEVCIKAGCPAGGVVLDPFSGAGTTGLVALRLGRSYVGLEINPEYVAMSRRRIDSDCPMFNRPGE